MDAAPVHLDDLSADVQPEAQTTAMAAAMGLVEALEDSLPFLRGHAKTMVAD